MVFSEPSRRQVGRISLIPLFLVQYLCPRLWLCFSLLPLTFRSTWCCQFLSIPGILQLKLAFLLILLSDPESLQILEFQVYAKSFTTQPSAFQLLKFYGHLSFAVIHSFILSGLMAFLKDHFSCHVQLEIFQSSFCFVFKTE